MASIYDTVPTWLIGSTYKKYDIVKGTDSKYYYSVIDSNNGQNPTDPANLQTKWDGYISLNGVLYPNFWWKPSYNTTSEVAPKLKINQFANGYQQRMLDGLNNNLNQLSLNFENRSEVETVSILHFLNLRNAQNSFIYNLPTIYSKLNSNLNTKFLCLTWSSKYVSYNNYSINADFSETPV